MAYTARYTTKFLSTPSARRATIDTSKLPKTYTISIHALREEGDAAIPEYYWRKLISIHALREEGDGLHHPLPGARRHF